VREPHLYVAWQRIVLDDAGENLKNLDWRLDRYARDDVVLDMSESRKRQWLDAANSATQMRIDFVR
jgi:hypothetical protein